MQIKIYRTSDEKENLCDSCQNIVVTCMLKILEFTREYGKDNVIQCTGYEG